MQRGNGLQASAFSSERERERRFARSCSECNKRCRSRGDSGESVKKFLQAGRWCGWLKRFARGEGMVAITGDGARFERGFLLRIRAGYRI